MATITIGFSADFENDNQVAISLTQPIIEHEQIWAWDHFFSLVLFRTHQENAAEQLLQSLSEWATGFASKMYSPINELHAENALVIDTKLKLTNRLDNCEELFFIELTPQSQSWPIVNVKIADDASPTRLAYAVIALAQYFLKTNANFFRELPMHILAMRKFYIDQCHYDQEQSIAEAPAFAFNTALKFYQSLENKIKK